MTSGYRPCLCVSSAVASALHGTVPRATFFLYFRLSVWLLFDCVTRLAQADNSTLFPLKRMVQWPTRLTFMDVYSSCTTVAPHAGAAGICSLHMWTLCEP